MFSLSAARTQDPLRNSEAPAVLHDIEIGSSISVNPECGGVSDLVHIRALIARIQTSKPTRAYQQSACHKLLQRLLVDRPFAQLQPPGEGRWMLARSESGAPRILHDDLPSNLDVSMAHSGRWVAVVLARGAAVGIDIEATKPRDNFAAMAKYMGWADRVENYHDFLSCWTLWEACVKLEKSGIFTSENAAFDALGNIERNVLAEAGQWAGLVKHVPREAHFALAIHRDCQAPLEIKG